MEIFFCVYLAKKLLNMAVRDVFIQAIWDEYDLSKQIIIQNDSNVKQSIWFNCNLTLYTLILLYPRFGHQDIKKDWQRLFEVKPYLLIFSDTMNYFITFDNESDNKQEFTFDKEEAFNHFQKLKEIIDFVIEDSAPKSIPNVYAHDQKFAYQYCLKYLLVSQYQSIKKIETVFPLDCQFIVFLGDNGGGKTAILQAIAIGLQGNYDHDSGMILCNERNFWIETESKKENEYNFNVAVLETTFNQEKLIPCFAAYGASRLQLQTAESMESKKSKRGAAYHIFRTDATLLNIGYWFKNQILEGKEKQVQVVMDMMVRLLPNIDRIERKGSEFFYYEKNFSVSMDQLSAGNKNIVAMIGDMIIRLAEVQPHIENPKDFAGIVLIDELDAHLHPKWQKEFPKMLSETFPKVQFIVSTHSAIALLGMPENTAFFRVDRNETEGTQIERLDIDVKNLTPNLLLTSPLFGLENIFSTQNEGIEHIHTGDSFEEKEKRQQAKNNIKNLYQQLKNMENEENN
ncbi:MAG: hypothetical protein EAZ97_04940 [Bacteroidetes bacterium]|nr:MAG: hypothetical protein EAZ97_04940 [Bacteroidota bacterium]